MKYIKQYEELLCKRDPEIGDYVVCHESNGIGWTDYTKKVINFIQNNIGKIVKIRTSKNITQKNKYTVKYENVPEDINDAFNTFGGKSLDDYKIRYFSIKEIDYCSNKEDCEIFLATKKYNI